jgi:DNA-binding response OmpR family regulator
MMGRYPRVLLVEEDAIALLTFTLELQAAGFEVIGAATAREAMGALRNATDGVAAAVIDLDCQSGGDPLALARAARALNAAIAVVYTARARRLELESAGLPTGDILIKPCPPKALSAQVRASIDGA